MSLLRFAGLSTISFVNILVHASGLKLLFCLYRNNEKVQTLLLIHMSAIEIFGSICWIVIDFLQVVALSLSSGSSGIIAIIQEYICLITSSTFLFVYYMVMVYIMIDKFLDIYLDLKYELHCTVYRVNNLMSVTWFIGWMMGIALILISQVWEIDYHMPLVKFIYPVFDVSVLIVMATCYGYVFIKYRKTLTETRHSNWRKGENLLSIIVRSHFRVTLILVATFIGLVMVPDLMYICEIIENNVVAPPSPPLLITYHFSFLSDAIIYIFIHPDSLRFLKKSLKLRLYGTSCERQTLIQGFRMKVLGCNTDQKKNQQRSACSTALFCTKSVVNIEPKLGNKNSVQFVPCYV